MANLGNISVGLTLASSQFNRGLSGAMSSVTSFVNQVQGRFSGLTLSATGVSGAVLGLGSGIIGMASGAVKAAADLESLEVTFTTLAGSAETAKAVLSDLQQFAAVTPFQFADLAKSVQLLTTYGFKLEESVQIAKRLGDLAAASPLGMQDGLNRISLALGQIRAKAKLSGEEVRQLAEAGVPLRETLANRLGVDVATAMKMIQSGSVSAREGIMAVMDLAGSPKFAGLMDKQSRTLNGLFSTLKDNVQMMMIDIGKIIIEGFDLKFTTQSVSEFVNTIRQNLDGLKPSIMLIGSMFGVVRDIIITAMTDAVNALKEWGVNIDGGQAALANLRQTSISFFEQGVLGFNILINSMKQFGGAVLENVIAPMVRALEMLKVFDTDMSNPSQIVAGVAVKFAAWKAGVKQDNLADKLAEAGRQAAATPIDAGTDAIVGFFNRVRAIAIGPAGLKPGGGGLGGPLNLDIPGFGRTGPKLSPGALMNSAEAFKAVSADINQRQGGDRDVPSLLKQVLDVGKGIKKVVDPLIPILQQNGIALLFPNG